MNARYWPCFGVNAGRESAAGFIVVLDSGGSATHIRYRVDLGDVGRTPLPALLTADAAYSSPARHIGIIVFPAPILRVRRVAHCIGQPAFGLGRQLRPAHSAPGSLNGSRSHRRPHQPEPMIVRGAGPTSPGQSFRRGGILPPRPLCLDVNHDMGPLAMAAPENLLGQETSPYLLQHAANPV